MYYCKYPTAYGVCVCVCLCVCVCVYVSVCVHIYLVVHVSQQVSYMEIYCERVRDLLDPKSKGNLRVRYTIICIYKYVLYACV